MLVYKHSHLLHVIYLLLVQPSYLAEPFACGQALISSVFDSLTTIVVHNPGIIDLLDCFLGSCISKSTAVLLEISTRSFIITWHRRGLYALVYIASYVLTHHIDI
jgi:hypothetical protein